MLFEIPRGPPNYLLPHALIQTSSPVTKLGQAGGSEQLGNEV